MVSKSQFYKNIEKYRRPGQTKKADVIILYCEYALTHGLVGVFVKGLDGVDWIVCVKLADLIELYREGKVSVVNMIMYRGYFQINYMYASNYGAFKMAYKDLKKPIIVNKNLVSLIENITNNIWLNCFK